MLDAILSDVVGIFKATFLGGDLIGLAIAAGAVLVAAMMMQRGTQVGSMTLLALALFAFGGLIRGVMRGPVEADGGSVAAQTGNSALGQLNASWAEFAGMQAGTLFAYFLAFMILILIVYGIKSTVSGGGGGH